MRLTRLLGAGWIIARLLEERQPDRSETFVQLVGSHLRSSCRPGTGGLRYANPGSYHPEGVQGAAAILEYSLVKIMLTIDGSQGEGGGQILRTSLALSLVKSLPFRIVNIRAGRKNPGLLRQHLTAVKAAAAVGRAEITGADIASQELVFAPGRPVSGNYRFAVGTAGSATLVLQTVLPSLLTADGRSTLTLEGGTHNPFAPPFDFLVKSFLPLIHRMGPTVEANLERPGFYPAGGGHMTVTIEPVETLTGFDLIERGEIMRQSARVLLSKLPRHIAERELKVIEERLGWPAQCLTIDRIGSSPGPGNVVLIEIESTHVTEVFAAFGRLGVKAESVASRAVRQTKGYLAAGAPVGEHLADQLLLPLALAGHGSFKTVAPSQHTLTNIEVIKRFLDDVTITAQQLDESVWQIKTQRSSPAS